MKGTEQDDERPARYLSEDCPDTRPAIKVSGRHENSSGKSGCISALFAEFPQSQLFVALNT